MELVPLCGILMDQSFKKVLLFLTHFGVQTYTYSVLPISLFSIEESISIPEADCWFLNNLKVYL